MEAGRDAERADGWRPAVSHIWACRVQTQSLLPLILVHLLGEHHVVLLSAWCDQVIIISSGPYPSLLQAIFLLRLSHRIISCWLYISMHIHVRLLYLYVQSQSTPADTLKVLFLSSLCQRITVHFLFLLCPLFNRDSRLSVWLLYQEKAISAQSPPQPLHTHPLIIPWLLRLVGSLATWMWHL